MKSELVGRYIDILLARRLWNFRSIAYSTMQYAMFVVMRDIRGASPQTLAVKLHDALGKETEVFSSNDRLRVHQQNRYALHRLLARLTDYIETESGQPSRYVDYVADKGPRYEIEHIWADHHERHADEFSHPADFAEYRNRIGGLLLLPKTFNASYGDLPYEKKLPYYDSQNLLARSLGPQAYEHNPGFTAFIARSGLPFRPHEEFRRSDIEARSHLYRLVAERLWDPQKILDTAAGTHLTDGATEAQ